MSGESYLNGLMSVKKELNKRDKLLCKARKSNEKPGGSNIKSKEIDATTKLEQPKPATINEF